MNYGDRQERASMLVEAFRKKGAEVVRVLPAAWGERPWTGEELAREIESETELGKSLVAVAGLVMAAKAGEFFNRG